MPAWLLDLGARRFSTQSFAGHNEDFGQPGVQAATTPCAIVRRASQPENTHFSEYCPSSPVDLDASLEKAMQSIFVSSMREVRAINIFP